MSRYFSGLPSGRLARHSPRPGRGPPPVGPSSPPLRPAARAPRAPSRGESDRRAAAARWRSSALHTVAHHGVAHRLAHHEAHRGWAGLDGQRRRRRGGPRGGVFRLRRPSRTATARTARPDVSSMRHVGSTARPPRVGPAEPGQTARLLRPLRRRADRMARPARVRMRRRKPCTLWRRRLFGWYVRLLTSFLRRVVEVNLVRTGGAKSPGRMLEHVARDADRPPCGGPSATAVDMRHRSNQATCQRYASAFHRVKPPGPPRGALRLRPGLPLWMTACRCSHTLVTFGRSRVLPRLDPPVAQPVCVTPVILPRKARLTCNDVACGRLLTRRSAPTLPPGRAGCTVCGQSCGAPPSSAAR